jgi:hypothetical protein
MYAKVVLQQYIDTPILVDLDTGAEIDIVSIEFTYKYCLR